MRSTRKSKHGHMIKPHVLIEYLGLPMIQPLYHLYILRQMKKAQGVMAHEVKSYQNLDFDNVTENVTESAKKYHDAKCTYLKLISDFQYQRLYEGFAESAPQACLQISIILMQGKCTRLQLISIAICGYANLRLVSNSC